MTEVKGRGRVKDLCHIRRQRKRERERESASARVRTSRGKRGVLGWRKGWDGDAQRGRQLLLGFFCNFEEKIFF